MEFAFSSPKPHPELTRVSHSAMANRTITRTDITVANFLATVLAKIGANLLETLVLRIVQALFTKAFAAPTLA
jgi:hypothetical protein